MKKTRLTIEEVRQWHQTGRLDEAKEGHLALINDNPQEVAALHLLGILYAELGELETAQEYLKQAIALSPSDPALSLHLANILKANGLLDQAIQVLLEVTQVHPHFAAAFNNLGNLYFAQENWLQAIICYQSAIDIQPNYIDAYYNLGLAFGKLKRNKEATQVYQSLLELAPHHPGGQFQLGCLLMQTYQYDDAIKHFQVIATDHPFHFETQLNLATCLLKLGHLNQAKTHYLQASTIAPNDTQVLFNLGVICMQQGQVQEAIAFYLRIVHAQPDFYEAHNNLGVAFLTIKKKDQAILHFREALRIQPENKSIAHIIHVLSQDKPLLSSPLEYIETLFDSYADHYDTHLKESLHYQVPELFYQTLKELCPLLPAAGWDILDLGCGTGLCGEWFKPYAHTLTGVDLSKKMLAIAAQKKIYDVLAQEDILSFLRDKYDSYDLILAGDVLVYIGELKMILSAISKALRRKGFFIFNTEISSRKDYDLTESGRYVHRKEYIEQLAKQCHLNVLQSRVVTLRSQQQENVLGYLFVMQK